MIKHEIKVEFSNSEVLKDIINKSYFYEGNEGKIKRKENYIRLDESIDDIAYTIFNGLNGITAKITNEIIDGSMRFMVDQTQGELRLYPISIYCIKEDGKYIFY